MRQDTLSQKKEERKGYFSLRSIKQYGRLVMGESRKVLKVSSNIQGNIHMGTAILVNNISEEKLSYFKGNILYLMSLGYFLLNIFHTHLHNKFHFFTSQEIYSTVYNLSRIPTILLSQSIQKRRIIFHIPLEEKSTIDYKKINSRKKHKHISSC